MLWSQILYLVLYMVRVDCDAMSHHVMMYLPGGLEKKKSITRTIPLGAPVVSIEHEAITSTQQ